MLCMHSGEYFFAFCDESYVRHQCLFVRSHYLCVIVDWLCSQCFQLKHGSLNVRVAKFKGLR